MSNNSIISYIDNPYCNKCIKTNSCMYSTRDEFINECLPFNNFNKSQKNILNFDKTSYIYFYKENSDTYYLKKDFSIKLINFNLPYEPIDIMTPEILTSVFRINSLIIPGFYLFCNYTNIFNIFTYNYSLFINELNNKIITKIDKLNKLEEEYKINIKINNKIKNKTKFKIINNEIGQIHKKIKEYKINNPSNNNPSNNITKSNSVLIELRNQLQDKETELKLIEDYLKNNTDYTERELQILQNNEEQNKLISTIEKDKREVKIIKNTINNIFQINKENIFIKFSFKFNIFNISLLCENYFDIITLLHNDTIELEDIIDIFKDYSLINIYYLINYYKTNLNIKNIDKEFMNYKIHNTNNLNKPELYDKIIHNEKHMKKIKDINIDTIYKELRLQLILIKKILNNIDQYIPNYKNLFLMAIISYRNNNNLINSTWGYLNKKYIKDFIINNTIYTHDKSTELITYYTPELPILYEYDTVIYKNVTYGNCMENTILQFLKVIFWNREINNYDFNKIKEIINDEQLDNIIHIFNDINNEKSLTFINTWTEYITELPNTNIHDNYGYYVFTNIYDLVEIKPTLNNLIIALKYLIKWDKTHIDNFTFMTNLITQINKDYKININSNYDFDEIELLFNEKIYVIILDHKYHASFKDILFSDKNNILCFYHDYDILKNIAEYLYNESHITLSNLNAYILYIYIYKKNIYPYLYSYITTINKHEKIYLINIFINTFNDDNNILYYLINSHKNILEVENINNINKIIFYNINRLYNQDKYNQDDYFYNIIKFINTKNIMENLNDDIIFYILFENNNTDILSHFILKLKEFEIYKIFSNYIWLKIVNNKEIFYQFINVLLKDLYVLDKWDSSVWITVFYLYTNIKYNEDSDNILILSDIEKLIRYKYNEPIEIDDLITIVINNMSDDEWSQIFNNIDFNLEYTFFKNISQHISNTELYNNWKNDKTWYDYLLNINNMLGFINNSSYDKIEYIKNILPLNQIFTKNINWSNLNIFLEKLFMNFESSINYDHIILYKIYDHFSLNIYNIVATNNNKIINYLLKSNECSKWSYDVWILLITQHTAKYINNIIKFNSYKYWTEDIWQNIIRKPYIICLFKDIILQKNLFETFSTDINNKFIKLKCSK